MSRGNVQLGPDEMEGDFARGKLRKEVSFFYLINPIKINFLSASRSHGRKAAPPPLQQVYDSFGIEVRQPFDNSRSSSPTKDLPSGICQTSTTSIRITNRLDRTSVIRGLEAEFSNSHDPPSPMIAGRPLATTWSEYIR